MSVKTYRRGVILICAALCGALTASLNIWSIFQKPLMEAYGFSPQSVSFAYTIVIAMIGLSGPIGGWLQRKAPAHIIMTVAGIGFGLGWFLTGFASTIPVLYISFGLLVGVCDGICYNLALAIATRWYPDKRGFANGVVRSIMKDAGYAHMGVGSAKGAGKAENAAKAAISSPLLETSIAGAHGVIINITSSPDIGLEDVETAAGLITQSAHPDANIIWGTAFDENLSDEMRVTVVATGFDNKAADGLRSTLGTAAAGTAPGVTASAPSAVFSAEVNTPSAASGNASAAKPVEEENSDTSYYDDLLAILNKRR